MEATLEQSRDVSVPLWLLSALPPGVQAHLEAGGKLSDKDLAWK